MPRLLNIAKTDEKPLMIDAAEVTALHVNPEEEELRLYNSQGELSWINYKKWNVDVNEALAKLEKSGNPLVCFPVRVKEENKEYPHYISPAAVTFITVSKPGEDGSVGVIAGVKGVGREETWTGGMTQAEFDVLLKAVQAAKPLFEYAPEDAHSRWYEAAALYIDPMSVTQIEDQISQLIVSFAQSGDLDIQIKNTPLEPFLPPDYVRGDESPGNKEKWNRAFRDMMAYDESIKEERQQARFDFAAAIAAENDKLISVSSASRVNYVRKEDVGYIFFQGEPEKGDLSLCIRAQASPSNRYGSSLLLHFKTVAERQKALDVLDKALSAPPRKPPSRHHEM